MNSRGDQDISTPANGHSQGLSKEVPRRPRKSKVNSTLASKESKSGGRLRKSIGRRTVSGLEFVYCRSADERTAK